MVINRVLEKQANQKWKCTLWSKPLQELARTDAKRVAINTRRGLKGKISGKKDKCVHITCLGEKSKSSEDGKHKR